MIKTFIYQINNVRGFDFEKKFEFQYLRKCDNIKKQNTTKLLCLAQNFLTEED